MVVKYSVGIDISSKKFDSNLSVIDSEQKVKVIASHKFDNTASGFEQCHKWIAKHWKQKEIRLTITMEATGVYYENCALFLFRKGYTVSVVLPNKAKKYLQSIGLKSKNDKIDAKGLARMGAEQSLRSWEPMTEFFYQLRELTRQYQSLQEHRTILLNQVHANEKGMFVNAMVLKQLKSLVAVIDKQIEATQTAIEKQVASNSEVADKVKKITTIKGLGVLTVATLIAETNGFALFTTGSQLVSFAGYDIVQNQSGDHVGKTRISKKGNSRIRRALHMPAFGVVKWEQTPFFNLYERTLEKHNLKMKSYVAVQKKLLVVIYALWKKNEEYDNNYLIEKCAAQEQMKKAA
jgi:Transposase and inactivated derivatives